MPRTRPLHLPSRVHPRLPLHQMVADVSAALDGDDAGSLLRVTGSPPTIGFLSLAGEHPLDTLLGFTAPHDWLAIGLHCMGRAHSLDLPPAREPRPVTITALVDRSGRGAGLLRHLPAEAGASERGSGDPSPPTAHELDRTTVVRYDDAPDGVVGDACRRALGLPTPPPPSSTAELWLRLWLDELVEAAAFGEPPGRYDNWEAVAALHPAARLPWLLGSGTGLFSLDDPYGLAEATLALAERWTWPRLRREPEIVALGEAHACRRLAGWMDDGMFARALLDDLTTLPWLARSTAALLPRPVLEDINDAILATGLRWWAGGPEDSAKPASEAVGQ